MAKDTSKSLLPILDAVDNFSPTSLANNFVPFYLSLDHRSPQDIIGQIALNALKEILARDSNTLCILSSEAVSSGLNSIPVAVAFQSHLDTPALRSQAIEKLSLSLREAGLFADAIGGRKWRNEQYTIYVHPFKNIGLEENVAFTLERSACELFGLVTWPGMLDNSVAGGIPHGMTSFESMIKECEEEASLSEDVSRKLLRTVGAVSYFFQ
ncbi:hypothetical protein FRC06_011134 [Ceratobasidium sp. 370]|nr:hypothetical protein FRC06_011134 [Ceratobasidium sp. 370]